VVSVVLTILRFLWEDRNFVCRFRCCTSSAFG
jgi:hypothetical protein